jgi:hypothetical protein
MALAPSGTGEPDEIVELADAEVVVTKREAEGVGESHQQRASFGAVIADQQQRFFGGNGGEEHGL